MAKKGNTTDAEQFIDDLNNKKEAAWYRLYEEFYPALCSYAERLAGENAAVEDIVQESMIALWDSSFRCPDIKALVAWLYKSVYNRTLNLIQFRQNSRRILSDYAQEKERFEEMAIDMAIEEYVVARVRQAIEKLPGQQRQIMSMSLDGMKVKAIAEALGVAESTVKMQKKRAYAWLRREMGEIWGILLPAFFPTLF